MIKEFFPMHRWGHFVGKHFSFLSPMAWTWLSLLAASAAFVLIVLGDVYAGLVSFLLSSLMDEFDGKVARYTYRATYIGGFTDGIIDRFVDFLMIFSFFFLDFPDWGIDIHIVLFVLLFATLLPPFVVAYANHRQAVPDPTEKVIWRFAHRVEYIVLFLAVLLFHPISPAAALVCVYLSVVLNGATVVQSIVLTFVKSRDYEQQNLQASVEFHKSLEGDS